MHKFGFGLDIEGQNTGFKRQPDFAFGLADTGCAHQQEHANRPARVGQAGAAGGYLGLVEALRQVTRRPLGEQVPDAELALVSGFGMINYDRGLCSGAAIVGRGGVS